MLSNKQLYNILKVGTIIFEQHQSSEYNIAHLTSIYQYEKSLFIHFKTMSQVLLFLITVSANIRTFSLNLSTNKKFETTKYSLKLSF